MRQNLLIKRRSLSHHSWQGKSIAICHQLQLFPLFINAKVILSYFSFRKEPDLSQLTNNNLDKKWAFPRCVDKDLIWHLWTPQGETIVGAYGIKEPISSLPQLSPQEVDLILIPAVACDYQGYRLGYGAGYYDRMLSKKEWQNKPTIGIVFNFAYLPKLPINSWDKKLNYICTENNLYSI